MFEQSIQVLLSLLCLSLLFAFIRLYRGPNTPNRTVAFDAIAVHAVGIFALFAMYIESPVLLDGAIITAVLGFLGTTMLARYLEQAKRFTEQEEVQQRDQEPF